MAGGEVKLLDPRVGGRESFQVVGGQVELERCPLSISEGEANPSCGWIQVKGLGASPEERSANPRNRGRFPDSKTPTVTFGYGQ